MQSGSRANIFHQSFRELSSLQVHWPIGSRENMLRTLTKRISRSRGLTRTSDYHPDQTQVTRGVNSGLRMCNCLFRSINSCSMSMVTIIQDVKGDYTGPKAVDFFGVRQPSFVPYDPNFKSSLPRFETRPDDVWIGSYPKSGTRARLHRIPLSSPSVPASPHIPCLTPYQLCNQAPGAYSFLFPSKVACGPRRICHGLFHAAGKRRQIRLGSQPGCLKSGFIFKNLFSASRKSTKSIRYLKFSHRSHKQFAMYCASIKIAKTQLDKRNQNGQ